MGLVFTDITLKNAVDVSVVASGMVKDHTIRQAAVRALVDTGAWTLVINETMREKLGLRILETTTGTLADGTKGEYCLAGPVEVSWKNRRTNCDALVLPNADETLLGAIPLEAMDLMIHPRTEEVVGVHGDQVVHSVR